MDLLFGFATKTEVTISSTDDSSGKMHAYVGEGRFTDDPVTPSAGRVWLKYRSFRNSCILFAREHQFPRTSRQLHPRYTKLVPDICWDVNYHGKKTETADGHRGWS